jgi:hypothetical protein
MEDEFRGYPSEIFLSFPSEHLLCSICLDVLRNPVHCPSEGHPFCRGCIHTHLMMEKKCPLDRSPLVEADLVPNKALKRLIDDSVVKCLSLIGNNNESYLSACDWIGKVSELENHISICQHAYVKCPNYNCDSRIQRLSIKDHLLVCHHGMIPCPWCGEAKSLSLLQSHVDVCPYHTSPCPNGCRNSDEDSEVTMIQSSYISLHRQVCPEEIISCPHMHCPESLPRRKMEIHSNDMGIHYSKLCEYFEKQNLELVNLRAKCSDQHYRILELEAKLGYSADTCSSGCSIDL